MTRHHSIAADADGELIVISNPGDGTLQLFTTHDWTEKAKFTVGGMPTAIVAVGGRITED